MSLMRRIKITLFGEPMDDPDAEARAKIDEGIERLNGATDNLTQVAAQIEKAREQRRQSMNRLFDDVLRADRNDAEGQQ